MVRAIAGAAWAIAQRLERHTQRFSARGVRQGDRFAVQPRRCSIRLLHGRGGWEKSIGTEVPPTKKRSGDLIVRPWSAIDDGAALWPARS
ncbi:hypothetical protein [Lysobacter sp. yr284]|uniref:hypothetical protein n=1 Tax=Lysobacter sp. yr284 TaxID=1761791 RepID=UPI001113D463|nr:hypothetical protein [Lysobacter sp. yr284]